LTPPAASKTPP